MTPMFETILVPLDGSELAERALAAALELKAKFGSRLILVRSVEPASHHLVQAPGVMESPAAAVANVELIQKMTEAEQSEAHTYLGALRDKLGADVEALVIEDDAADAIVQTAAEKQAGLIVMSSHGRGGLGRLVFGSVADAVLRRSPVPVLLLRSPESS
jgi:nucleotide-binding universal stress UspA family protein